MNNNHDASRNPTPQLVRRRPMLDGVRPVRQAKATPRPTPRSAAPANIQAAAAGGAASIAVPVRPKATAPPARIQFTPPARKASRLERFQLPLIIIGASIAGLFIQNEVVGIAAVVAYSLCAFIFRIPSRTTFALATLSIVAVACLLLFKPNLELASNFTTYTFLLLVTGVITLIVEGRPLKRRKRSRPGLRA